MIRDSPVDYINVTAWGTPDGIENLYANHKIGDVIDLINPKVLVRKLSENEDYLPPSTSCFELIYTEGLSQICSHDKDDCSLYISIFHLPTKPIRNVLKLSEIYLHAKELFDKYINVLVAIEKIGEYKEVGNYRKFNIVDVDIFDETAAGIKLNIWGKEWSERIQLWKPRSVLFISDAKVKSTNRNLAITTNFRTIITENPTTDEAIALIQFAANVRLTPLAISDSIAHSIQPDAIRNIISCQRLLDSVEVENNLSNSPISGIIYGVITNINLDDKNAIIMPEYGQNTFILSELRATEIIPPSWNIRLSIADHTAQLENLHVTSKTASETFNMNPETFRSLTLEEKIRLKWSFQFKKVSIRLTVLPQYRGRAKYTVVEIKRVSFIEYANKVPIY